MPSAKRIRFAAILAAAALSGGALGACNSRENASQGNNGGTQATGTVETNPSTVAAQGKPEKTVTQAQHSVTSTQPGGTITQPSQTVGTTNSGGG